MRGAQDRILTGHPSGPATELRGYSAELTVAAPLCRIRVNLTRRVRISTVVAKRWSARARPRFRAARLDGPQLKATSLASSKKSGVKPPHSKGRQKSITTHLR